MQTAVAKKRRKTSKKLACNKKLGLAMRGKKKTKTQLRKIMRAYWRCRRGGKK